MLGMKILTPEEAASAYRKANLLVDRDTKIQKHSQRAKRIAHETKLADIVDRFIRGK